MARETANESCLNCIFFSWTLILLFDLHSLRFDLTSSNMRNFLSLCKLQGIWALSLFSSSSSQPNVSALNILSLNNVLSWTHLTLFSLDLFVQYMDVQCTCTPSWNYRNIIISISPVLDFRNRFRFYFVYKRKEKKTYTKRNYDRTTLCTVLGK